MLTSEIKQFTYPDGSIERVQAVRMGRWEDLGFFLPEPDGEAMFASVTRLYSKYAVPRAPFLFPQMVLFRLPAGEEVPFSRESMRCGALSDSLAAAAAGLRENLTVIGGKPVFRTRAAEDFFRRLEALGCIRIIGGLRPGTAILPVGEKAGLLSRSLPDAALKANLSFFIMDCFDVASVYDSIGTPVGLRVKNGIVESPPLFAREALLVRKDGAVSIEKPALEALSVTVQGETFVHGKNTRFYARPRFRRAPCHGGTDLVIIGNRVAAVHPGGGTAVPGSGFVLAADAAQAIPGDTVTYGGMEEVLFGVQVGNSCVVNGRATEKFTSPFYKFTNPFSVSYPPSLYPMDYEKARAPRMMLGGDADGKPLLLFAEGPGKLGYEKGRDSRGASLSESAAIARSLGMVNGVHLDGGGSAQILLDNRRSLRISDRYEDNSEAERPVPVGLCMR